uniref:NAD(P)-binding domain-containing protein n=1 Tax=Hemiselmis tepida TaxID=464990 RepID=A0A7S0W0L1_9CRYP|mmetsp:Transcript_23876/g.60398  ORF Transcript_23876/g.60398 Transcript_23876/m.60398 type:complete len:256 (+) Transcript_23876:197-964(+)|eukprot:CAMPEP_0174928030 /NCGR_PEP_ID=MMETSP1355-20121228/22702_1 /TAXON_ID=464990 /ORGANISM="Hemiselmis tepida, Strain CCMP443" /LENGTH=255 /DNA_ID=CAMNT_0016174171 /DNA_START=197 /DNA_END=964 /DNA_ORIENTATION=-
MGSIRTIAVLFSSVGSGMGDVGKFCIAQGITNPSIKLKPVALSAPATEGSDATLTVDVTYQEGHDRAAAGIAALDRLPRVDIMGEGAQEAIEAEIAGCDAVVACLGSRQPSKKTRWLGTGSTKVVAAMKAKGVSRLVNLSSMGIGDDYLPPSFWKRFWWCFLRVVIPGALKDLNKMEEVVVGSGLDYLQVRAMGLTPEAPPKGVGSLTVLDKCSGQGLEMMSSKEDVAAFMLQEAAQPTRSRAAVTVGYAIEKKK